MLCWLLLCVHARVCALVVIAESGVTVHKSDHSARYFFRVAPSTGNAPPYTTTPFHCSCPAFTNQVVVHNTHLFCKHQVGAMLAEALSKVKVGSTRRASAKQSQLTCSWVQELRRVIVSPTFYSLFCLCVLCCQVVSQTDEQLAFALARVEPAKQGYGGGHRGRPGGGGSGGGGSGGRGRGQQHPEEGFFHHT